MSNKCNNARKSNKNASNNGRVIVRVKWVIVDTCECAPRKRTTFMQDLCELAPAFGLAALFMGALVATAVAAAAIVYLIA